MEMFREFNGTLLKLFVTCGSEEHCVLFKLESKPRFNEVCTPNFLDAFSNN